MASYVELSDPYQNFMRNPAPAGEGICPICRGFTSSPSYVRDRGCGFHPNHLDAFAAISYAPVGEQLHHALRGYKDDVSQTVRRRLAFGLASVLWRFLIGHERCVAAAAGASGFDVVVTVPSKTAASDDSRGGLREIAGRLCQHTAPRFERLLRATGSSSAAHSFDPDRFESSRALHAEAVLLVDDMWTSGGDGQSAAHALKRAGAARVGMVAIGRWVDTAYLDHGSRYAALPRGFSWSSCALHRS